MGQHRRRRANAVAARREAALLEPQQQQQQQQQQHQLDENAFKLLLEPDKDLDELVQEAAPAPLRAAAGVTLAALSIHYYYYWPRSWSSFAR